MENFHEIMNSNQEEEPPLFLDFPSPFFDGVSTTPIHTNNYTHHYHLSSPNNPINITEPLPSESKSVKKRSASKKDRHSKIHTAQGLRDRRMRLSLHIARKFFDLQDLLGFDKASKTIEWLFCKSNKAIKEVAENFSPQDTNKSMSEEDCEVGFTSEIKIKNATNNPENSKDEEIKIIRSRKQIRSNSSVRETRDKARARARDRTRERLLIKELEKSKLFGGNPKQEIHKLGLGYLPSPNNHNAEEIGFTSSPSETIQQESSSSSLEHSCTHHLLQEPYAAQSATIHLNSFEDYTSNWSTLINHNPPAGWLNTCQGFLPGEWDADKFVTEYNYGIVPNYTVSLTGDIYEQNPSSFLMSSTTNILHVQSQNQGK